MLFDITNGFSFTVCCQQSKLLSASSSRAEDFAGTA